MRARLGINNCFAVKRWPRPDDWASIVANDLGLDLVELSLDQLEGPDTRAGRDRMAEQTRRVGLLKAVGGTPTLVAIVLLSENLLLALAAAVLGLVAGDLLAPLLASPGQGLLGTAESPHLTAA